MSSAIEHMCLLSKDLEELNNFKDCSDLTIIVADQKFHAHKTVLAARSMFFRGFLFAGHIESSQREVELKNASPEAFEVLLKYIYTGRVSLADKTETVVLHILGLAHIYGFLELENSILDYFCDILNIRNICPIYDAAIFYDLEFLTSVCLDFMDTHAIDILDHESFIQLSSAAVKKVMSRDSFDAPEREIFLAIQSWVKANRESDKDSLLNMVRLELMSTQDLLNIARPTGLFSSNAILDAIAQNKPTGWVPRARKRHRMYSLITEHQRSSSSDTTGNINHICQLSTDFAQLRNSEDYSDLMLIVADQKFQAHKSVLAVRSEYFRALLFGGLKESKQKEIELKDASPEAFEVLLRYIYTGRVSLADKTWTVVFYILGLAHLYGFLELENSILDYFREILNIYNICPIYDAAILYKLEFLTSACLEFIDNHATTILKHESFLQLSSAAVHKLLHRNSVCAPVKEIFLAIQSWLRANPESDKDSLLNVVRLEVMSTEDLLNIAMPTGLFSSKAILDAIAENMMTSQELDQIVSPTEQYSFEAMFDALPNLEDSMEEIF